MDFLQFVIIWVCVVSTKGIRNRYVTDNCPGSVGPTTGDVIRFDSSQASDNYFVPTSTIDCYMTLRGVAETTGEPQRYATLAFRDSPFSIEGVVGDTNCSTAFIEIYNATSAGVPISPPVVGPMCGTSIPADVTTDTNVIILRLYVEPSANSTCTNGTTDCNGPFVNFTADFTSYHIGNCSLDSTDDTTQLFCDPGSQRCIDRGLRCDYLFSDNCGDGGDIISDMPGICIFITSTPEESTPVDLLPLWIILGILAGLIMAYWCCWRPGWFPWRVARLRNLSCCRGCCQKCQSLSCCKSCGCCGPQSGSCGKLCTCCSKTGSGYPNKHPAYNKAWQGKGTDPSVDSSSSPPGWLKFATGDGAHVREMR